MNTTSSGDALLELDLPPTRECTRCDGAQGLIGGTLGMGKYRCEECGMVVGFDLEADPAEFLLDRGLAGRYTKHVFGDRLGRAELRLTLPNRA